MPRRVALMRASTAILIASDIHIRNRNIHMTTNHGLAQLVIAGLFGLSIAATAPAFAHDAPHGTPFTFTFTAVDGTTPVDCTSRMTGFGPDKAETVGLNDLRFYVSDIHC